MEEDGTLCHNDTIHFYYYLLGFDCRLAAARSPSPLEYFIPYAARQRFEPNTLFRTRLWNK